jgi:hypothetical protein
MSSLLAFLFYTAKQDTNLVVCFRFCWLYWCSKVAVDIMVHQGGWLGQHSNSTPSPTCMRTLTLSMVPSILWINPIPCPQCRVHTISVRLLLSPTLLQPMNYQGFFCASSLGHSWLQSRLHSKATLLSFGEEKNNTFSFYFKALHGRGDSESLII